MLPLQLLLDENLSPQVALDLRRDGIDCVHVRERGMLSASDAQVLERAFVESRVLVTCFGGGQIEIHLTAVWRSTS